MIDDHVWKQRYFIFMAARMFGLAMMLLGVAIAWSDLVREGGWPLLGGFIALMGVIDAVFAPRLLKKHWEMQDAESGPRSP